MTHELVKLKSNILLLFEKEKCRLAPKYCDVIFSVTEDIRSQYGKSYIHLSAYLKNARLDLPDSLDLTVEFSGLNSDTINVNADIYWAEFGLEDCFMCNPVALTVENATKLYYDLPRLIEAFGAAVERKKPKVKQPKLDD